MSLKTINPSTGEPIKTYPTLTSPQIKEIISNSQQAFLQWSLLSYKERAKKLKNASQQLLKNKKKYAELMALEMGKPITAGLAEVEKCSLVCNYYAEHAETLLQPKLINTEFSKSYVTYEPTGIIFAIMPWNFPLWQVFRFAAPNLMGGNACLLKHAEISTGTALEIERLLQEAGFPPFIFQTLLIHDNQAAEVIAHPHVTGVTLTGSGRAGRSVARLAGENLKKVVLELGGSDPYLILEDADLKQAAQVCVRSRLANSGQICIAAKRIIAVAAIYDELLQHIQYEIKKYRSGNPLDKHIELGPLAREDLRAKVHDQVQRSILVGAKLLLGGVLPQGPGFYYPPTLLADVMINTPAFTEEIFGPVVAVIKARDTTDGIRLANQTEYGLGAAVFTQNKKKGEEIAAHQLKAGTCAVNTFVHSDPRLPFGGIKNSGYGRELAIEGLTAFLNIKTITIY